ncbi:MAG: Crp/Fnr family transcriptional regulator [Campylobacterales bacterium]|nr:Crp/Fnr family transcriptional regulator [Campylobacterales bacterium]
MAYTLESICLFSSLNNEQLKKLRQMSSIVKFNEGNIIFYEGDSPSYLYFLLEGLVKIYKYDNKDSITILDYYYTQALIGEAAVLGQMPHSATAECDTNSTVLVVEYKKFAKEFLHNPQISTQIIMHLVEKIKSLQGSSLPRTSMQKVAKLVHENSEIFKKLKKYKIAAILNMTPETFSRNLKTLKKEGIISYGSGFFDILDSDKLLRKFENCH